MCAAELGARGKRQALVLWKGIPKDSCRWQGGHVLLRYSAICAEVLSQELGNQHRQVLFCFALIVTLSMLPFLSLHASPPVLHQPCPVPYCPVLLCPALPCPSMFCPMLLTFLGIFLYIPSNNSFTEQAQMHEVHECSSNRTQFSIKMLPAWKAGASDAKELVSLVQY